MIGTRDRVPDSALIARARRALAEGPLPSVTLMGCVCSLPDAPTPIAERLADALFSRHADFGRDAEGRWILTPFAGGGVGAAPPSSAPQGSFPPSLPAPPLAARDRGANVAGVTNLADAGDPVRGVRLRTMRFAVVDVETTGCSALGSDRVTEIAVVHVEGGEVTEVYETLVNPERSIPPAIVALTKITWEMVKDAPRFADVSPHVVHRLRERVFVAHNASFDWRFVSSEVRRASGALLAGEQLCTVRLARILLPQLPRRTLDSVTNYFGVSIGARHRAAGDAIATAHVLTRLLRVAEDRGVETWDDLVALIRPGAAKRKRRRRSAWPRSVDVDPTI